MADFDYDVLIVGSGFGGGVAALRAAEKGYRVGAMQAGKRWHDEDIPKGQWHLRGFPWFPTAELYGIRRVEYVDDVLVPSGAGVGGGSTSTPTRCTSPRSSSSTLLSGRASPTGPTNWPLLRPGDADARRCALPVPAH